MQFAPHARFEREIVRMVGGIGGMAGGSSGWKLRRQYT